MDEEDDVIFDSPQRRLITFVRNQRKDCVSTKNYAKLNFQELMRIHLFMHSPNIFGNECTIYTHEKLKKSYVAVSYNGRKVSLLRLLYLNFVDDIKDNDVLKCSCEHQGVCMTMAHYSI